jgi:molybdate transport system substrate-binding protein
MFAYGCGVLAPLPTAARALVAVNATASLWLRHAAQSHHWNSVSDRRDRADHLERAPLARLRLIPLVGIAVAALAVPVTASATTIYAASSLKNVVPAIAPDSTTNFAGSDTLTMQIEQGAPADVFLSAAPYYAERLHKKGLCDKPVVFALNTLMFVTPKSNPAGITKVQDLNRPGGYRLAIGSKTVPLGMFTRTLLGKLGLGRALLKNIPASYQKASEVTTSIVLGSASAGFIYTTDWFANAKDLHSIPLPASAQPLIRYEACTVIRPGVDKAGARAVIANLISSRGRRVLATNHFGLPPKT